MQTVSMTTKALIKAEILHVSVSLCLEISLSGFAGHDISLCAMSFLATCDRPSKAINVKDFPGLLIEISNFDFEFSVSPFWPFFFDLSSDSTKLKFFYFLYVINLDPAEAGTDVFVAVESDSVVKFNRKPS